MEDSLKIIKAQCDVEVTTIRRHLIVMQQLKAFVEDSMNIPATDYTENWKIPSLSSISELHKNFIPYYEGFESIRNRRLNEILFSGSPANSVPEQNL
jgi:hypothetical protein